MQQRVQQFFRKIDALSLRERAFIFATATLGLMLVVNMMVLDPQFAKQKKLADQARQNRATMAAIETGIQQALKSRSIDPDASNLARLQALKQQYTQVRAGLSDMQEGLVAPERMATLLEDILKQNGSLRLVSLKTLPVDDITKDASGDASQTQRKLVDASSAAKGAALEAAGDPTVAAGAIYRHGVEMTLQGNYLDMVDYLAELESMPWQLFWGSAKLNVDVYPKSTLTLTVFTLSLDKKWLNL